MSRLAALAVGLAMAAQAAAQVPPALDPGSLQQRRIDEERRREQLERLERKPVTDPLRRDEPAKPAAPSVPDAVRFMVREIRFTPSEILSAAELEALAAGYRGRTLGFSDLQQLAARVNALYKAKGVVTAQAVIPPQDVSGGVVTVRLVEGRVGRIEIEGNASTRADYVTDRLSLKPADLVDLKRLEEDLVRFNRTNEAQLRAELKPGRQFATTDLALAMTEPPRHEVRVFLDNSGSEGTGEWRAGATYLNRSVLGYRDDLSLTASGAEGQESYSAAYNIPVSRSGGRAGYAWYKDLTSTEEGPLAPLGITGESVAHIVSLRQPVLLGESVQVDFLGGAKKRKSTTWISGILLQELKTVDMSLGAELQVADSKGYWLASYSAIFGRAELGGIPGRDAYAAGRGSVRRVQNLPDQLSARFNLNFQHTGQDLLPSSEQFFIGGEYSVRGYPNGAFSGDTGYFVNLELHHPIANDSGVRTSGFFFFDAGSARPSRPPGSVLPSSENLWSFGWGLNAELGERWSGRLTFALPCERLPLEPRAYWIHFQLVGRAF